MLTGGRRLETAYLRALRVVLELGLRHNSDKPQVLSHSGILGANSLILPTNYHLLEIFFVGQCVFFLFVLLLFLSDACFIFHYRDPLS